MQLNTALTPYELMVQRNIEDNRRVLRSLGLLHSAVKHVETKPRKLKKLSTPLTAVSKRVRQSVGHTSAESPGRITRRSSILNSSEKNECYGAFENNYDQNSPPYKKQKIVREAVFGEIEGVNVGDWWPTRMDCSAANVHRPTVAGIHGKQGEGCYSIALSGGYEDDLDCGECFTYTGCGGRDLKGTKSNPKNLRTAPQSKDQILDGTNAALASNIESKKPVRVIRGYKLQSPYAPEEGYRYDGLYSVEKCWLTTGLSGFKVCKFALKRITDQDPPPWITHPSLLSPEKNQLLRIPTEESAVPEASLSSARAVTPEITDISEVRKIASSMSSSGSYKTLGNKNTPNPSPRNHGKNASLSPKHIKDNDKVSENEARVLFSTQIKEGKIEEITPHKSHIIENRKKPNNSSGTAYSSFPRKISKQTMNAQGATEKDFQNGFRGFGIFESENCNTAPQHRIIPEEKSVNSYISVLQEQQKSVQNKSIQSQVIFEQDFQDGFLGFGIPEENTESKHTIIPRDESVDSYVNFPQNQEISVQNGHLPCSLKLKSNPQITHVYSPPHSSEKKVRFSPNVSYTDDEGNNITEPIIYSKKEKCDNISESLDFFAGFEDIRTNEPLNPDSDADKKKQTSILKYFEPVKRPLEIQTPKNLVNPKSLRSNRFSSLTFISLNSDSTSALYKNDLPLRNHLQIEEKSKINNSSPEKIKSTVMSSSQKRKYPSLRRNTKEAYDAELSKIGPSMMENLIKQNNEKLRLHNLKKRRENLNRPSMRKCRVSLVKVEESFLGWNYGEGDYLFFGFNEEDIIAAQQQLEKKKKCDYTVEFNYKLKWGELG